MVSGSPSALIGRILLVTASALGLLAMFLPWAGGGDNSSENAWQALRGGDIIVCVLGLTALGLGIALFFANRVALRAAATIASWLVAAVVLSTAAVIFTGKVGIYLDAVLWIAAGVGATLVLLAVPATAGAGVATARPATGSTSPATTPAGWYPDPSGAAAQRYWSGTAWTDQVR
jgi:hypothetical protein